MNARHAGEHGGNHRPGEFVDEPPEERIFLRRSPDHGHRPDRPLAMPHMIDPHHGKVVLPRVVPEMIAERSFRLRRAWMHRALDHEIRIGVDRGPPLPPDHRNPVAGEHSGKRELREPFGQRHHRRDGQRRRTADEDRHPERLAPGEGRCMVYADPAVNLVVEADFPIVLVGVARELHAIHAEVRVLRARPVGVLGVDGRQRDERAAVTRPAGHPRQTGERNLTGQHGAGANAPRQHREGVVGRPPIAPWPLQSRRRIDLELHEPLHAVE